jgi:phytoene dehydrogenase-like protein
MEYSVSMVSLFATVDLDLRAMGYDSGNYWWFRHADVSGIYERMEREMPNDVDALFLTITTLKTGEKLRQGRHTIEMFTFVPYTPFACWSEALQGARGPEYAKLKHLIARKMLRAASEVIPGIEGAADVLGIGTPLTNDFYCATFHGAALGTAKTRFQIGPFGFGMRSSIRNLFNVGASTLSHGVGGAARSGIAAAQEILGGQDVLAHPTGKVRIHTVA